MKEQIKILKKHILTGTSHMIPFIVAGGILFSISVMLNPAGAVYKRQALDGVIKESIKDKIRQIARDYHLTTIIVTHDPERCV